MKFEVEATRRGSIDITPVAASILTVMMKPYNQFLDQMLRDERVTEKEVDELRQQVIARAERLDELVNDELPRMKEVLAGDD